VVGGDRQITLEWAPNRELDLVEYRIYRTSRKEESQDLRLMSLAQTKGASDQEWVDVGVQPAVSTYYILVAVNSRGLRSPPSRPMCGRAFDDSKPPLPTWSPPVLNTIENSVALSWTDSLERPSLILRRAASESTWVNLTGWQPMGTTSFADHRPMPGTYIYRLKVIDSIGRISTAQLDVTI
jgi:hypothetical protein